MMDLDAIQTAIFTLLDQDVSLSGMVKSVQADVIPVNDPEDVSHFPYVTIGRDTGRPWDSKTWLGAEALVQIDSWSRSGNFIEGKNIHKRIWELLHHQSLTITGANHVMTVGTGTFHMDDPDGVTKRGMSHFSVFVTY